MTAPDIEVLSIPLLSQDLLERPLEYIIAEHDRHRTVCAYLKRVTQADVIDGASAHTLSTFLRDDIKRHFEDERLSLFPALFSRSGGDLDFIQSLHKIEACHADSEIFIDQLADALDQISPGTSTPLSPDFSRLLMEYAALEHQNLAFENSVIMVIAEVRLKKADIEKIRAEMKMRRRIPLS